MCDNLHKVSDALAKQKQNPLNKLCASCYIKSNKETSVSNELETTNNNKMIIEGDNEKNLKIIILRIVKDVPEEVSCTKKLSVQSSVKLPKLLPLAIRNTTVVLNKKSISIVCFKKMYIEKRNIQES